MATRYPIRAVARATGLSADTLRAWERRYGAVAPDRDERGRVYTDRHIARLKMMAALVERGHAIGTIGALPDAALRRLGGSRGAAPAATDPAVRLDGLLAALKRYDLPAIDAELNRYALLLPAEELIFAVVLPVLRELGSRWQARGITAAQEHLVSSIVRGMLGGLLRTLPRAARGPRALFATASGERHELGLLCGAVLAAARGYAVIYLGPDLPAADIAHAARQSDASLLVLSGTTAAAPDLGSLRRLPNGLAIWTGGPRADELRSAIGSRARVVDSLEEFRRLVAVHL